MLIILADMSLIFFARICVSKWRQRSVAQFLETGEAKDDDHQIDGGTKVHAITAPFSFLPNHAGAAAVLRRIVSVTQMSTNASTAADIVSDVLLNCFDEASPTEAVTNALRAPTAADTHGSSGEVRKDFASKIEDGVAALQRQGQTSGPPESEVSTAFQDILDMFGSLPDGWSTAEVKRLLVVCV